jgi:predicted nucleotidyltransferase
VEQTDDGAASLPAAVREGLERFCDQLREALGGSLVSIVLYGGLAKNDGYDPRTSDVNVMVVLTDACVDLLDRAAAPTRAAVRDLRLAPMVLSEHDLRRSTDVFPVKFRDMQRHHYVLWGKDVLGDLHVADDHLRLRCEQEIKNLMLRLRRFYLLRGEFPEAIQATLARAISSLLASLGVLAELKTGQATKTKSEAVDAADKLGLDGRTLRSVLALKRGELQPDASQLKQLFDAFMQTVSQAAEMVDSL